MVPRSAINQALVGFLGTYTSRYSEYDGYWLLGFLVACPDLPEIDLLQSSAELRGRDPIEVAVITARRKFAEQLEKAHAGVGELSSATLTIENRGGGGLVFGRHCVAMSFRVSATVDGGRTFAREVVVNVAAHDPAAESRSARTG